MYGENPIIRARQEVIEAFVSKPPVEDSDMGEGNIRPGDPELANPREPYSLLKGWLKPLDNPMYPSAEKCHDVDFQVRLERTGNFRQMTNNYKRGDPDSCSGQTQDLTLAFYKTEPVPQDGCIQPYVEHMNEGFTSGVVTCSSFNTSTCPIVGGANAPCKVANQLCVNK